MTRAISLLLLLSVALLARDRPHRLPGLDECTYEMLSVIPAKPVPGLPTPPGEEELRALFPDPEALKAMLPKPPEMPDLKALEEELRKRLEKEKADLLASLPKPDNPLDKYAQPPEAKLLLEFHDTDSIALAALWSLSGSAIAGYYDAQNQTGLLRVPLDGFLTVGTSYLLLIAIDMGHRERRAVSGVWRYGFRLFQDDQPFWEKTGLGPGTEGNVRYWKVFRVETTFDGKVTVSEEVGQPVVDRLAPYVRCVARTIVGS